ISIVGCENRKLAADHSVLTDSIVTYLDWANSDSISVDLRLRYNDRAFTLLKNRDNDSITRDYLFKVANRYYNHGVYDKYKSSSEQAMRLSLVKNDTINIAKSFSYMGDYFLKGSHRDSAFYYYLKAEKSYITQE